MILQHTSFTNYFHLAKQTHNHINVPSLGKVRSSLETLCFSVWGFVTQGFCQGHVTLLNKNWTDGFGHIQGRMFLRGVAMVFCLGFGEDASLLCVPPTPSYIWKSNRITMSLHSEYSEIDKKRKTFLGTEHYPSLSGSQMVSSPSFFVLNIFVRGYPTRTEKKTHTHRFLVSLL